MIEGVPQRESGGGMRETRAEKKARVQVRLVELDSAIRMAERAQNSGIKGSQEFAQRERMLKQLTSEREFLLTHSLEDLDDADIDGALGGLGNVA